MNRRATPRQVKRPCAAGPGLSRKMWKHGLFLFLLTFLVNVNTLTLNYALDDSLLITQNKLTQKGLFGLPEIWSSDVFLGYFGKTGIETGGRYRPMSQTLFALQLEFFGSKPIVGHFFNTFLYAVTCLMLYFLLYTLFPQYQDSTILSSLPFVAVLIYAMHPLHAEVVANIKSLDEILAMLCAVTATRLFMASFQARKGLFIGLGASAFFLALVSKENSLTFLAVIPLTLFYLRKDFKEIFITVILPLLASVGLYFLLRGLALGADPGIPWVDNFLTNPFFGASLMQKLATVLTCWLKYLELMVFPHPLTTDYYPAMVPVTGWGHPRVWISLLCFAGASLFAVWKLPKRNVVSFGILYFLITFSITSNLLINMGTPLNDRFMFMPLAGLCVVMAYLLTDILPAHLPGPRQRRVPAVLILIFSMGLAAKTFSRNLDWKDDFTLFQHDIQISAKSARCNVMTGKTYYDEARSCDDFLQKEDYLQKAELYVTRGLEIYDRYYLAWTILGIMDMEKGNYRQARDRFERSLKIEPAQGVCIKRISSHEVL